MLQKMREGRARPDSGSFPLVWDQCFRLRGVCFAWGGAIWRVPPLLLLPEPRILFSSSIIAHLYSCVRNIFNYRRWSGFVCFWNHDLVWEEIIPVGLHRQWAYKLCTEYLLEITCWFQAGVLPAWGPAFPERVPAPITPCGPASPNALFVAACSRERQADEKSANVCWKNEWAFLQGVGVAPVSPALSEDSCCLFRSSLRRASRWAHPWSVAASASPQKCGVLTLKPSWEGSIVAYYPQVSHSMVKACSGGSRHRSLHMSSEWPCCCVTGAF